MVGDGAVRLFNKIHDKRDKVGRIHSLLKRMCNPSFAGDMLLLYHWGNHTFNVKLTTVRSQQYPKVK